jgi:hypothetical protein
MAGQYSSVLCATSSRRRFVTAAVSCLAWPGLLTACGAAHPSAHGRFTGPRVITVAPLLLDIAPHAQLTRAGVENLREAIARAPWFSAWLEGFNRWAQARKDLGRAVVGAPGVRSNVAGLTDDEVEPYVFGTPPRLPAWALDLSNVAREVGTPLPKVRPTLRGAFTGYVVSEADCLRLRPVPGMYAMPLLWSNACVIGNKTILEEIGLTMPDGFAQFTDLLSFVEALDAALQRKGLRVSALDAHTAASPGFFQSVLEAAGGSLDGAFDSLENTAANRAALAAYAEIASHCRAGNFADGSAAVGFVYGGGHSLGYMLPEHRRCILASLPRRTDGRVLRSVWGLRLDAQTPSEVLGTAFGFLLWAASPDGVVPLSVEYGMAPAAPDQDTSAWMSSFSSVGNLTVLTDGADTIESAFLAPIMQDPTMQAWLQSVVAQWTHINANMPQSGADKGRQLYEMLRAGMSRVDAEIAAANNTAGSKKCMPQA